MGSDSTTARLCLLSRSRYLFPTRLYRFHPWNRTTYIHVSVLGNSSSVIAPALPYYPPSMVVCITLLPSIHGHMRCSRSLFPTRLYQFHPWNRNYAHPWASRLILRALTPLIVTPLIADPLIGLPLCTLRNII